MEHLEFGHRSPTGAAPGRPEINDDDRALECGQVDGSPTQRLPFQSRGSGPPLRRGAVRRCGGFRRGLRGSWGAGGLKPGNLETKTRGHGDAGSRRTVREPAIVKETDRGHHRTRQTDPNICPHAPQRTGAPRFELRTQTTVKRRLYPSATNPDRHADAEHSCRRIRQSSRTDRSEAPPPSPGGGAKLERPGSPPPEPLRSQGPLEGVDADRAISAGRILEQRRANGRSVQQGRAEVPAPDRNSGLQGERTHARRRNPPRSRSQPMEFDSGARIHPD